MKLALAAAAATLLLMLLTWLSTRAIDTDAELFDGALAELDRVAILETALKRDVLSARAGLLRTYDPLVMEVDGLRQSLDRLRAAAATDRRLSGAAGRLAASIGRQEGLGSRLIKSTRRLLRRGRRPRGSFAPA